MRHSPPLSSRHAAPTSTHAAWLAGGAAARFKRWMYRTYRSS